MNNEACDDTTDRPVSLNNKGTPDAAIFVSAKPAPTDGSSAGAVASTVLGGWGFLLQSDNDGENFE